MTAVRAAARPALTAWAVTSGEDGMRTQARGLAQAVAGVVIEKTIEARSPWTWLTSLGAGPLAAPLADGAFAPPWPDLLVTCGRRSVSLSMAVRAASNRRCLTVHIQDPRAAPDAFDLVVAMDHDRIAAGPGVIKVATALHDLTSKSLKAEADIWRPRLAPLGRPLVGVIIGGDLKGRPFTLGDAQKLLAGLTRLRRDAGVSLAVTPSRRTPPAVRALLIEAFRGDPKVFLWDLAGANPYLAILALADRLVVTSDSVSMVSEAISTPHPVEVFDLGFARHAGFLAALVASGRVRPFEGDPAPPKSSEPVNATIEVAAVVRSMLQRRTGVVG
jgi:mitochondrial fission protein ELM1